MINFIMEVPEVDISWLLGELGDTGEVAINKAIVHFFSLLFKKDNCLQLFSLRSRYKIVEYDRKDEAE